MSSPPTARLAAWSAFLCGDLHAILVRPSSRSFTPGVTVCVFSSRTAAARLARRWAIRLGITIPIRTWAGELRAVSIPIAVPSSRWPPSAGRMIFWSGGGPGFARALLANGITSWEVTR